MVLHHDRMSRRSFGVLSVGAVAAAATFRATSAQDASPAASPVAEPTSLFEALGLPVLDITATEFTYSISNPGADSLIRLI